MHGQVCEASGVHVTRNANGRATCPLCGDDWHVLTKAGCLRRHVRVAHRTMTAEQIRTRLAPFFAQAWCREGHHTFMASTDSRREVCARCPTWRWKDGQQP